MFVFWVVTRCELVDRYQLFGKTYCIHLQVPDSPHGVTTEKTNIQIFTAVRKSNLPK
jgi:hypothetical protein